MFILEKIDGVMYMLTKHILKIIGLAKTIVRSHKKTKTHRIISVKKKFNKPNGISKKKKKPIKKN